MSKKSANTMWGGRFTSSPSEIMEEINASVAYDKRLAPQDIRGSIAHARMLGDAGIISKADVKAIIAGLETVEKEIAAGHLDWSRALEDVHMNIESRLKETIGEAAGRLHTARSRNDQVATDFRLYVRDTIDAIDGTLAGLQRELAAKAETHSATVMPGFTHLQPAQPVTFGHHLLAYVEMISRDRGRFADARRRLNECPLGAAALAGTSFPIDRKATAAALGFDRPTANSLDSVSDRDFVLETLSAACLSAMHLSRFAEEIVIWSTPQFGFIKLSDAWTTGSSIMPQKRNPDVLELLRASSATAQACLDESLMITAKLPSGYQRDLQRLKSPLFRSIDLAVDSVDILAYVLEGLAFRPENIRLDDGIFATAEAYRLVTEDGLPFRDAYREVARRYAK